MKSWELLLGLAAYLTPLVTAAGGKLQVAKSLEHAHKMLNEGPQGWSLILHYEGVSPHPNSRDGMAYRRVATVIQQEEGLKIRKGDALFDSLAGGPPMLARTEQVSEWMRALKFPDGLDADCAGFSLEEEDWVESKPQTLAMSLSWQLEVALPHFSQSATFVIPA